MTERATWQEVKRNRAPIAQAAYDDEARISEFQQWVKSWSSA